MNNISKIINGKRVIVKKPELLAPASNLEKLKIAIEYGADAVYFGGQDFGLRANASNFSLEETKEAADYAHSHNAKVYLTVNIIFHNDDVTGLDDYLKGLEEAGVDAIMIADPLVIERVKEVAPKLGIFISTQQSTINYEAIKYWEEEGAQRIVLGRETSKEEIKENIEKTNIGIETFIHGSMCMAYSGRCGLSNHMTMRDSNRGGCSQNCRWEWPLVDEKGNVVDKDILFSMSAKDLVMIKEIPEMIEMGICAFKIEGRMRSMHYIASVVNLYRKLIDEYCKDPDNYKLTEYYEKEAKKCANRKYASQYFNRFPTKDEQYYNTREEKPTQEFIGIVLDYKDGTATIEQRNYFKKGDVIEVFGPQIDNFEFKIESVMDEDGNEIDIIRHPRQIVKIKVPKEVYKNNMIRLVK